MYESFLSTVPILSSLKSSERAKIADVLESRTFNEGEDVLREGDEGDEFFLIESGSAQAFKNVNGKEVPVKSMGVGDYFGGTYRRFPITCALDQCLTTCRTGASQPPDPCCDCPCFVQAPRCCHWRAGLHPSPGSRQGHHGPQRH